MTPEPTEAEQQQIAEIKTQLAPVLDALLLEGIRNANASLAKVADSEIERCISIAQGAMIPGDIPASLVGWNEAVVFIVRQLESWRKKASEP